MLTIFVNNGFNFLMPSIAKNWQLDKAATGNLASLAFVGMFFGALVGGMVADRIGRKPIIVLANLLWGVAAFVMSFATSYELVQVCRFFIGIGLGAQLPTTAVMISEMVPSRVRAKYLVANLTVLPIGVFIVGMVTYWVLPMGGWTKVVLISGLVGLWGFAIWKFVPESALWLESRGRYAEADKAMDKYEEEVQKRSGQPLPPVEYKPASVSTGQVNSSPFAIFTKPYLSLVALMTVYLLCQMMGYYGISMWLTSLLTLKGFTVTKSILYVSLITLGGVPSFFLVSYLADKIGRKMTLVLMAVLTAIGAFFYGQAATFYMVIATGLFFMFVQFGYNSASMVFTTEIWPTSVRASGKGYTQSCGRVGAALGPMAIGYILAAGYGNNVVFGLAVAINLLAAVLIYLFAPETKGKVF
jgi:putative MFS transporter